MINNVRFADLLDQLVEKHIAFAAWFAPGSANLGFVAGNASDVKTFSRPGQLNNESGFVFAPFYASIETPIILLKPCVLTDNLLDEDALDIDALEPFAKSGEQARCRSISSDDYIGLISKTIDKTREGNLSKVVISRQIPVERRDVSSGSMFFRLHEQTPNAFVYLVNLPIAGLWMGATPETLLGLRDGMAETVSLAGTQARVPGCEEYFWSTKDIEEQAFVSRYMLDVFFKFDIHKYKTIGPETLESGKVAHLKTSFFFPFEIIESQLGDFIAELHPTPAVCGLPKDLSISYISDNEPTTRNYYTGFLGPWRLNKQMSLFVNLRCMELTDYEFVLYVGGGITSRSVPEREWDETCQKAKTLLSVINPEIE